MSSRHETIGIKQAIRLEWMQKTANLLLAGLDAKTTRMELHEYLANRKGSGADGQRSKQTRKFVVNNLMKIWGTPDSDVIGFRNASLAYLRDHPSMALPVHWGMLSAAYPFWYHVARQTGRLLALQDQVTHSQIINRLKEQYGDRQTISRYGRYVLRSFVAWGVLKDSDAKGCYERAQTAPVLDSHLATLLLESVLLASPEAKGALGVIVNNPGLFPFVLPTISSETLSKHSQRIEVLGNGLDDSLLQLKRI